MVCGIQTAEDEHWPPACQAMSQLKKLHLLFFRHSGLDPESSPFLR